MNSNSLKIATTLLVLTTLFSLLECSSLLAHEEEKDFVMNLCKKTHNYDLCMSIIYQDTRKYGTDPKRFAKIVMEKELNVATEILVALESLASDKSESPKIREKCGKCFGKYKAIVYTLLPTAKKALDSGKIGQGGAIQAFKDVANYAKACSDQFSKGSEPFINMSVHDMSMLAIDLVQLITY
ncbi:Cell wall / vacuolar inhibitor of fructosidase 1 [Bienertia sinuspersici]